MLSRKGFKFSSHDKPSITPHMKKLKRQRMREYRKHGKSEKYYHLLNKFKETYVLRPESTLLKMLVN